eukprot:14004179-Alexandrium_andersonii.AAC.1
MARMCKKAARMYSTGVYAQMSWGVEGLGASPATVKRIRRAAVASLGMGVKQFCSSTAIELILGPGMDPELRIRKQALRGWLMFWHAHPELRHQLRVVWARVIHRLASSTRWCRVKGPAAAVVATLFDLGWKPTAPDRWYDEHGQEWAYTGSLIGLREFEDAVFQSVHKQMWSRASSFFCGAGVQSGVDFVPVHRLANHYKDHGRNREFAMLVTVCSGGCWTAERRFEAGLCSSPVCPRCGNAVESMVHRYWQCPANEQVLQHDVALTGLIALRAVREAPGLPCLWLRGLPPRSYALL